MRVICVCVMLVAQLQIGMSVFSQMYKNRAEIISDLMWEDTDVVIQNNQCYLINKSLLLKFDGYKNIFPEIEKAEISYEYGAGSPDYDMNYVPYWMIQGDSIYLIGISLNTDLGQIVDGEIIYPDFRLPIERFLRMEKLVKKKFEKTEEPMVDIEGMSSMFSCGRMFASWISGVYYIKPVMEFDYDIDTWKKEPILKLTIKDGKIIKTEKV